MSTLHNSDKLTWTQRLMPAAKATRLALVQHGQVLDLLFRGEPAWRLGTRKSLLAPVGACRSGSGPPGAATG
jgi:hypothetical protein